MNECNSHSINFITSFRNLNSTSTKEGFINFWFQSFGIVHWSKCWIIQSWSARQHWSLHIIRRGRISMAAAGQDLAWVCTCFSCQSRLPARGNSPNEVKNFPWFFDNGTIHKNDIRTRMTPEPLVLLLLIICFRFLHLWHYPQANIEIFGEVQYELWWIWIRFLACLALWDFS